MPKQSQRKVMLTQDTSPKLKGMMTLALGVASISFAAPLFKLSQPVHPLIAAATRLSFATCLWGFITLYQVHRSKKEAQYQPISWSDQLYLGALCGLCYAIHFGAWVWSLGLTSVIASATLVTTTPIMLGLIAWFSGKDKPSLRLLSGGLVASLGIITFILEPQAQYTTKWIGDLLALLGALAMVPYLLLTRKHQAQIKIAPFSMVATFVGASLLWLISFFTVATTEFSLPKDMQLYALLGTALIPQLIGHSALTISLRYFTPTEVGIATLLEPIGASYIAWLLLGEQVTLNSAYATVITLLGVLLALKGSAK